MEARDMLDNLKKIGVIGIKGKTTTAKLILHLLERNNVKGIYLKFDEIFHMDGRKTEKLSKIIDQVTLEDLRVAVIEMSSFDLSKAFVNKFEFDSIIHTNTALSQGDNDKEQYHLVKMKPFKLLSKNGVAIINIDDKSYLDIVEGLENKIVVPYGFSSKATLTASSIETSEPIKFTCCIQRGLTNDNNLEIEPMEFPVSIEANGNHNIQNSLAAITQALLLGVSPETIGCSFSEGKKYSL